MRIVILNNYQDGEIPTPQPEDFWLRCFFISYQEALLRQRIGRVQINHRFRFEERFIKNRSFRTRYRYALFMNIPLNQKDLSKTAWYLALYNEVFLHGYSKEEMPIFDRNRLYGALGYKLQDRLAVQLGYMWQNVGGTSKGQLQLSVHHSFEW